MLLAIGSIAPQKIFASDHKNESTPLLFFCVRTLEIANALESDYLRDHVSEYAHSLFYSFSNSYIIFIATQKLGATVKNGL